MMELTGSTANTVANTVAAIAMTALLLLKDATTSDNHLNIIPLADCSIVAPAIAIELLSVASKLYHCITGTLLCRHSLAAPGCQPGAGQHYRGHCCQCQHTTTEALLSHIRFGTIPQCCPVLPG